MRKEKTLYKTRRDSDLENGGKRDKSSKDGNCGGSEGGKSALYPHQEQILVELELGARYVVAQPRTGKTRPVIAFLAETPKVLVLTKKAAIGGWISELEAMGVTGWTVVNYEKVRTKGWDMSVEWGALVCDEAHSLGKYPKPNLCVKEIYKMHVKGPRIGISATPCAESYSQLFHQVKALRMDIWDSHKNFYAWHKSYGIPDQIRANGRMLETYKVVKEKAWEEFRHHAVVVDRQKAVSDFVEAEDKVVELVDERAIDLCKELNRDGLIRVGKRVIVAETPLAVAQKCQQLCAGVVLDDSGEPVEVSQVKAKWLWKAFKGQKIAVLTGFKAEVGQIGAGVEWTDDAALFQSPSFKGWFLGSWQRFARGVDLSAASAVVITSCPWSSEGLQQGRDRLLRRDRTTSAPVYFPVIQGGIDEQIYKVVAGEKREFTARQYR
jgi:hypothetical protein